MKLTMSTLQRRISVALTAVVLLFVSVQGYLAFSSLERQEDDLVDEIVLSETHRLVERLATGLEPGLRGGVPLRLGPNMRAWLLAPGASHEVLPPYLRDLGPGPHMEHLGSLIIHVVIEELPSGRLVVEYDATANEAFVYRFGIFLVLTGIAFVALGWLLSVWVAGIVVAPIRRLANQLADWSPSSTAPTVGTSDEETLLLQAFDQAQRRMDEALANEREFAANVRHEVRTPLAALRTDAELLLLTERIGDAGRARLQRMINAVDAVSDAVEAAHALASSAPARPEAVDLSACVDSAWASLQHLNSDATMALRNLVGPNGDHPVLDRQALMTVLRNLLRNAIQHAGPGTCEVRRTDQGLSIADDGRGMAPDILPRIFDRYFSGRRSDSPLTPGGGSGLGLAIAEQTALRQGWTLAVRSSAGKGTVFTLDFAPQAEA